MVNTLGINLWGDWEMKPELEAKRGRGGEEPKFVVGGERAGRGGMDLDKLSEMERRMGLGGGQQESRGGRGGRDGWR